MTRCATAGPHVDSSSARVMLLLLVLLLVHDVCYPFCFLLLTYYVQQSADRGRFWPEKVRYRFGARLEEGALMPPVWCPAMSLEESGTRNGVIVAVGCSTGTTSGA
uniref:Uncharacterized protein n=1 Tax=Anopheles darlingi TaxID=43151 RepID=A0A2M4DNK0_ANODA